MGGYTTRLTLDPPGHLGATRMPLFEHPTAQALLGQKKVSGIVLILSNEEEKKEKGGSGLVGLVDR